MPYALEPLIAGELGEGTLLDDVTYPPTISAVEYVLDAPTNEDLIESFPVFLVSASLAEQLASADLAGFTLDDARVVAGREYRAIYGDVPHKKYRWLRLGSCDAGDCWLDSEYRLCVSDRMFAVLRRGDLSRCSVEPATR